MKAVLFRKGKGLVCEEIPRPRPEPDQVLVQVADTGFCGSDHTLVESGGLPDGYILGHETSGTVTEIGSDVAGVTLGSRVIVRPTFCATCGDCAAGRPYFCQHNRRSIGVGDLPGAFAETIAVYPQMLIPIPPGVDSRNAALAEAFSASLHGINCAGDPGGSALVIGGGPIGLALVRLLKVLEYGPIVLSEPVAEKRDLGKNFGADAAFDPLTETIGSHVMRWTDGAGFDTVFECAGVPDALQTSMDAARRGGRVCVVSVGFNPVSIVPVTLNFKEIWVTGAYSNTHEENIRCLDWMAEGRLDATPLISDIIPLEDLPRVYREKIHTGKAVKVVVQIGPEF
jgi:(R,R)-butanediol dehydrogenase/meso-butanediol dehydrogenase/diacetyl reductase